MGGDRRKKAGIFRLGCGGNTARWDVSNFCGRFFKGEDNRDKRKKGGIFDSGGLFGGRLESFRESSKPLVGFWFADEIWQSENFISTGGMSPQKGEFFFERKGVSFIPGKFY